MSEVNGYNGPSLDEVVGYSKRTGMVFPSSEIYGGYGAIYDWGPLGVELANNVKEEWWKEIVRRRQDTVGLDSAIFMRPKIWEASGHVDSFSDPFVECLDCHTRVRADHLLAGVADDVDDKTDIEETNLLLAEHEDELCCPNCSANHFTEARNFNLLVASNLGNFTGDPSKEPVWLRGETCQGIYVNYKNVLNAMRLKLPFGIAQIGKSFRNEITTGQFIFRTREFEQMENQRFVDPARERDEYEQLRNERWEFYVRRLGFNALSLRWHEHEKLAFYAKAANDIEFKFPFGFAEVEGVHARGDYDLSQHMKFSGTDLRYRDPGSGERFVPHVIESSCGVGRIVLAALCDGYTIEKCDDSQRLVLKIHPNLSPVKVGVFPLVKNNPDMVERSNSIHGQISESFSAEFDKSGSIGKRYRRQDEIGTPFCATIDYDTLENGTITVRERDAMRQTRIDESQLEQYVRDQLRVPYIK